MANEGIATGPAAPLQHSFVQSSLGCWQQRRFDFHLVPNCTTRSLLFHRAGQQDAQQLKHVGLVAAADGSADLCSLDGDYADPHTLEE